MPIDIAESGEAIVSRLLGEAIEGVDCVVDFRIELCLLVGTEEVVVGGENLVAQAGECVFDICQVRLLEMVLVALARDQAELGLQVTEFAAELIGSDKAGRVVAGAIDAFAGGEPFDRGVLLVCVFPDRVKQLLAGAAEADRNGVHGGLRPSAGRESAG